MSGYYEEDDELDIRVHRGRSPAPVVYPEHRYRPAPRPYYDSPRSSSYLVPAVSGVRVSRSRSHGRRTPPSPPAAPAPAPVIINNTRIYNDYEDDDYLALAPRHSRDRSTSRHRPASFSRDPRDEYELDRTRRELEAYKRAHTREEFELEQKRKDYELEQKRKDYELEQKRKELEAYKLHEVRSREEYELEKARKELEKYKLHSTKEDYELERTKKELEAYKLEKEREAEEKRIKKEMELKRLVEEKKAEEEKERLKKESEKAIAKYKAEEAEKAAKEKKEKEEREKEYQHRLEEDLRKSGMSEQQISVVLKKDKGVDPNRPTYTRMSRKHLSIETLNRYRIDYEWDQDPEYVLIKRWVPEYEQDFLWAHTKQIREARRPMMLAIEEPKRHHHHSEETEFAIVRKKKHERRPSPSPLLTFLAGGKR
ncbi:hypothetical protein V8E51_003597 [Hyaloscypha variabilis]|uniref:DUF8035 domain-containing protein n=1 Tax=Hyaloscypha variabilis (strain UAMH 11265 / GT02V1 / F) TaxID=1149755 RepID=A0A2J6SC33_HYAVF|nr:hypothetical protein L207DRAFT_574989 [Hyaloscypha variabilis F]